MLSLEEIEEKLKDRKLYAISQQIEVSYPTLKKLADGKKINYTLDTIRKVSNYFTQGVQNGGKEDNN